jgi:hypothetical protein
MTALSRREFVKAGAVATISPVSTVATFPTTAAAKTVRLTKLFSNIGLTGLLDPIQKFLSDPNSFHHFLTCDADNLFNHPLAVEIYNLHEELGYLINPRIQEDLFSSSADFLLSVHNSDDDLTSISHDKIVKLLNVPEALKKLFGPKLSIIEICNLLTVRLAELDLAELERLPAKPFDENHKYKEEGIERRVQEFMGNLDKDDPRRSQLQSRFDDVKAQKALVYATLKNEETRCRREEASQRRLREREEEEARQAVEHSRQKTARENGSRMQNYFSICENGLTAEESSRWGDGAKAFLIIGNNTDGMTAADVHNALRNSQIYKKGFENAANLRAGIDYILEQVNFRQVKIIVLNPLLADQLTKMETTRFAARARLPSERHPQNIPQSSLR